MALATRCPNCQALFRVAPEHLKLRDGLVRCGACQHVFDGIGTLSYIDDAALSKATTGGGPAIGAVIAAIRKAETVAGDSVSLVETSPASPPSESEQHDEQTAEPAPEAIAATAAESSPAHLSAEEAQATEADGAAATQESGSAPMQSEATTISDALHAATSGTDENAAASSNVAPALPPESDETAVPLSDAARPASPGDVAAAEMPGGEESSPPSFLREAEPRKRRLPRLLWGALAALLALLAVAQVVVALRAEILAQYPQARPALGQLCRIFRCTVDWPTRADQLAVVGSDLQSLANSGEFELTAVVRNRGNVTLALPAIELTLSDTLNRIVARKVFLPADYLAGEADAQMRKEAGLPAGADLSVRIAFEARGINAAGFVVYPFYF